MKTTAITTATIRKVLLDVGGSGPVIGEA